MEILFINEKILHNKRLKGKSDAKKTQISQKFYQIFLTGSTKFRSFNELTIFSTWSIIFICYIKHIMPLKPRSENYLL
jgi:hypothetical protein